MAIRNTRTDKKRVPALRRRRVHLRHPRRRDAKTFIDLVLASRRFHRPWVYPPSDEIAFRHMVRNADTGQEQRFLLCRVDNGELVGVVELSQIARGVSQSAYLGFYGFAPSAGQGYVEEGVALVIRYAFTTLKLHRLEANIQPENKKSLRLVRRCGLRKEGFSPGYLKIGGRWRDHERWAILSNR